MTKKLNSFTNIITVLLALLLLGIAAGPAGATITRSGNGVIANSIANTTLAGSVDNLNFTANITSANNVSMVNLSFPFSLTGITYSDIKLNNFTNVTAATNISINMTTNIITISNNSANITNGSEYSGFFSVNVTNLTMPTTNTTYTINIGANDTVSSTYQPQVDVILNVFPNVQKYIVLNPNPASGFTSAPVQLFVNVTDVYGNLNNTLGVVNFTGVSMTGSSAVISVNLDNATSDSSTTSPWAAKFSILDATAESITATVLTNTSGVSGVSATVNIVSPITNVVATPSKTSLNATALDQVLVQAQLKAADGSNVLLSGQNVTWYLNNTALATLSCGATGCNTTTNANGIANLTLNSTTTTGVFTVSAFTARSDTGATVSSVVAITSVAAPDPSTAVVSNTSASIKAGSSSTITATVKNYAGAVLPGVVVTFSLNTTGVGSISVTSDTTDDNGNASTVFSSNVIGTGVINVTMPVLGVTTQVLPGLQTITVGAANAYNISVSPATLSVGASSGNNLTINATILDIYGNLNTTALYTGNFSLTNNNTGNLTAVGTSNDGLVPITPTTTTSKTMAVTGGYINVTFTSNGVVGTNSITVNMSGAGLPVLANVSRTITTANANGMTLTANRSIAPINGLITLTSQLTLDGAPIALSAKSVTYAVTSGSATLSATSGTTNGTGAKDITVNSSTAGQSTVIAQSDVGSAQVVITFAGSATSLSLTPSATSGAANTNITITVQAKDVGGVATSLNSAGEDINGNAVTYSVTSGTATVPTSGTFNATGVATFNVTSATAGSVTVRAIGAGVLGTTTVSFGAAPALAITRTPTTVTVGTPTSVTFTVTSSGAAVSGATVALSGNVTAISNTTDASGIAIISVNATSAGTITATASKSGYTDITTTITANVPGPASITGVTITPANPSAGEDINLTVAINNPGASFNGRVEGNVWAPDGTGKYLGWENVVIPSGVSSVTITGAAGGDKSSYIAHAAGNYSYDVFLENVDSGQDYRNATDSELGVAFTIGAADSVSISNIVLSASPANGSVMTLSITISNPTASAFTGTMNSNVWDSASGHALTPQSISIVAGGSQTLTFSYTPVKTGLHSYDFFMVSAVAGQNDKDPWGFSCMDYIGGIGFTVV